MADQPRTGFQKWQDGINRAVSDPQWNRYDCELQNAVNEFNQHLTGVANYVPLDWQMIKAMLWVESGASSNEWMTKPMQIGVVGDPGLTSLLTGNEGGDLILPPLWKSQLTVASVRAIPEHNIRAGIGYLLMRMATFEYRSVLDADTRIQSIKVQPGDNLDKIAKAQGSTVEILKKLNPVAVVLRSGQVLQFQKASVQRVITGWRVLTSDLLQLRYNGGGDPSYSKKIDYALGLVRQGKAAVCTS
jgi:hypothetical protein